MKIENVFRKIPEFSNIVLDTILFESKYPVMFTCKNKGDLYLFICCLVSAEKVEWIGSKTTYDNLIDLLENKITIRDAFLNITENKIIIEYNGKETDYKIVKGNDVPDNLLPTAVEYMEAEEGEYVEEIALFKQQNVNIEYLIKPRISRFVAFHYKGHSVLLTDDDLPVDLDMMQYRTEKVHQQKVLLA